MNFISMKCTCVFAMCNNHGYTGCWLAYSSKMRSNKGGLPYPSSNVDCSHAPHTVRFSLRVAAHFLAYTDAPTGQVTVPTWSTAPLPPVHRVHCPPPGVISKHHHVPVSIEPPHAQQCPLANGEVTRALEKEHGTGQPSCNAQAFL